MNEMNAEALQEERAFDEARVLLPELVRLKNAPTRRSIKCLLLPARLGSTDVMVKFVTAKAPLWRWYLAREAGVYGGGLVPSESFAVPRLHFASERVLVTDRANGKPMATTRHHEGKGVDDHAWHQLHAALRAVPATAPAFVPSVMRSPESTAMMRKRLLEDPDMPVAWVTEGFDRAADLAILTREQASDLRAVIEADAQTEWSHGDLLLRNIIRAPSSSNSQLTLVDWECAGHYVRGWDAALVWTFAPAWLRTKLEEEDPTPRFRALIAFALIREIAFRLHKDRDNVSASFRDLLRARLPTLSS